MQSKNAKYFEDILLVIGFIYLIVGLNYGFNVCDEANSPVGAMRILAGEVPYRDFWSMHAPGQYYLIAGFFSLGEIFRSIIAMRILSAVLLFITAFSLYKTAKLLYRGYSPIMIFVLAITTGDLLNFSGRGILTAIMLLSGGTYFFLHYLGSRSKIRLAISGALFGLTICFRHDFVLYIFIIPVLLFVISHFRLQIGKFFGYSDGSFMQDLHFTAFDFLFFAVCTLIFCVPFYAYVLSIAGFEPVFDQLIASPVGIFTQYRSLSFPIPFAGTGLSAQWGNFAFYLPAFIAFSYFAKLLQTRKDSPPASFFTLFLLVLLLHTQAWVRSDFEHAEPALLFSLLLVPFLINSLKTDNRVICGYIAVLLVLLAPAFCIKMYRVVDSYNMKSGEYIASERAKGIAVPLAIQQDYSRTIKYISANSQPNERIFICNRRNNRSTMNDMMLYFLADRLPATKYHELYPGVTTRESVQHNIAASLRHNKVRLVVKVSNNFSAEPNLSAKSESPFLDTYIKNNFVLYDVFGDYAFYFRKDLFEK